jgi:hypothetical protein
MAIYSEAYFACPITAHAVSNATPGRRHLADGSTRPQNKKRRPEKSRDALKPI